MPYLFAIVFTFGATAIGSGVAGLVRANKGGGRKGMAIDGIVLGALSFLSMIAGIVFTIQLSDKLDDRRESRYERSLDDYDDEYDSGYGDEDSSGRSRDSGGRRSRPVTSTVRLQDLTPEVRGLRRIRGAKRVAMAPPRVGVRSCD